MPAISAEELRDGIADVLRRAEAGEEFAITVAGRPVARLGPASSRRRWVEGADLAVIWARPAPGTLAEDLARFDGEPIDPFA